VLRHSRNNVGMPATLLVSKQSIGLTTGVSDNVEEQRWIVLS
jgi:hypothetical protein